MGDMKGRIILNNLHSVRTMVSITSAYVTMKTQTSRCLFNGNKFEFKTHQFVFKAPILLGALNDLLDYQLFLR